MWNCDEQCQISDTNADSMKALKLYVYPGFSHPRDFDTRRTTIRARVPRKNSGNGIAKRNIPVGFTSTISL